MVARATGGMSHIDGSTRGPTIAQPRSVYRVRPGKARPAPASSDPGHEESVLKRLVVLVAAASTILLAGCGGAGSSAPAGSASPLAAAATQPSSAAPSPSGAAGSAAGDLSAQFGGDVCSALTTAEIEAATYPQGPATFSSTDTQKDATTGKAVVCQYLVTFGGAPSLVGVAVSLMDATEFATRVGASMIAPPEAVPGVGTEAYLVAPAPGLFEVWVSGPHGDFKVGAQAKTTATALATIAAGRN